jgi:hypothetical protein
MNEDDSGWTVDWTDHQPTGNLKVIVNSLEDLRANFTKHPENDPGNDSGHNSKNLIVRFSDYASLADDHKLKLGHVRN